MKKVPCSSCGNEILPTTAERNKGLCAKCKRPSKKVVFVKSVLSVTLGSIFILIGVFFLLDLNKCKKEGTASINWPSTEGVVSKLLYKMNPGSPKIEYTYNINGEKYTSRRINYGSSHQWRSKKQVGDIVTVYYDEDDPKKCTLQTGFQLERMRKVLLWCYVGFICMGCLAAAKGLIALLIPSGKGLKQRT
jgi:hypothetical protein